SFKVLEDGTYTVTLRYQAASPDTLKLSAGAFSSAELVLSDTGGEWAQTSAQIHLNKGENLLTLDANGALSSNVRIDNITIDFVEAGTNIMPLLIICIAVVAIVLIVAIIVLICVTKKSKKSKAK